MSEYQYQSWESAIYEKAMAGVFESEQTAISKFEDSFKAYLDGISTAPDMPEFIEHQKQQIRNAADQTNNDPRWRELIAATGAAEAALTYSEPAQIAFYFYRLGKAVEAFENFSPDEKAEYMKARLTVMKQDRPRFQREAAQKTLRKAVQSIAAEIWEADTDQECRIGDVAGIVRDDRDMQNLADRLGISIPKDQAIREWLREIAPAYASAKGRPKKE